MLNFNYDVIGRSKEKNFTFNSVKFFISLWPDQKCHQWHFWPSISEGPHLWRQHIWPSTTTLIRHQIVANLKYFRKKSCQEKSIIPGSCDISWNDFYAKQSFYKNAKYGNQDKLWRMMFCFTAMNDHKGVWIKTATFAS